MPSQSNELLALRAQTAQAAYATIFSNATLADDLARGEPDGAGFTPTQAAAFAAHYEFVAREPNDSAGFSWTLFRDKQQAGKLVLAMRGTDEIPADLLNADLVQIGLSGYATTQAANVYRAWRKLTTPAGELVKLLV
jgi:hypothetical protein